MDNERKSDELALQVPDYAASAVRAVLGAAPFAGSLLAELAGTIVPNQRVDRIIKFLKVLEVRLSGLEQVYVRSQLTNENFADLLEEGTRQAARSLSDERRAYIANLIGSSLSSEDIEYIESRRLLRILEEIDDIEIIWLRFYQEDAICGDEEFRDKHASILEPIVATLIDPPEVHDKEALQESHIEHLAQLGLLLHQYEADNATRMPRFDSFAGGLKIRGYEISALGRLLLKFIGLSNEE
jgi:hypothetical protein